MILIGPAQLLFVALPAALRILLHHLLLIMSILRHLLMLRSDQLLAHELMISIIIILIRPKTEFFRLEQGRHVRVHSSLLLLSDSALILICTRGYKVVIEPVIVAATHRSHIILLIVGGHRNTIGSMVLLRLWLFVSNKSSTVLL